MDPILTNCPNCQGLLSVPDGVWMLTCGTCGIRLDLSGHFAFLRALAAFEEGQEVMQNLNPKKQRAAFSQAEGDALKLFMEAYSSLQVAFQHDLAEVQRQVGVEMMTSMATEFMKRNMVSSLEANYWNSVMVEQTAQEEIDRLRAKLNSPAGKAGFLRRWRWSNRIRQLRAALAQSGAKLTALESQIAFVEIPHARKRNWN
jgi:hypothetical protein